MTRKEFLQIFGSLAISDLFISSLLSCNQRSEKTQAEVQNKPETDPCENFSQLTKEDLEIRNNLEYVNETPIPEKRCNNCELWIAPEESQICGGCQIMHGPVKDKGYCTAWIVKENS